MKERGNALLADSKIGWHHTPENKKRLQNMIQEAGVVPGLTEEVKMITHTIRILEECAAAQEEEALRHEAYSASLGVVLAALREPVLKQAGLLLRQSQARGGV